MLERIAPMLLTYRFLRLALTLSILIVGCGPTTTSSQPSNRSHTCLGRSTPPLCYSPQQLRTAYDVQPLLDRGVTGKGRTIVIIAVGGILHQPLVPFSLIRASLHAYDQLFNLPDTTLTSIAAFGGRLTSDAVGELLLDIELAHTFAPGSAIAVIIPPIDTSSTVNQGDPKRQASAAATELLNTIDYAVRRKLGDVISLSYSLREDCFTPAFV
jgi:subtilase family serine protease